MMAVIVFQGIVLRCNALVKLCGFLRTSGHTIYLLQNGRVFLGKKC